MPDGGPQSADDGVVEASDISKLGGKVMEVMVVMNWEVMNSCSNGSKEEVIALQNDHAVMKMADGVMM